MSLDTDDWNPRFNIAPTQPVPVVRQHPKEPVRQIARMGWGLVPYWAKDASGSASTIDARSETAAEKPAFRDLLTTTPNAVASVANDRKCGRLPPISRVYGRRRQ